VSFSTKKKTRQKSEKKKLPSSHHSIVKQFLLCDVTNNEKDFFFGAMFSYKRENFAKSASINRKQNMLRNTRKPETF